MKFIRLTDKTDEKYQNSMKYYRESFPHNEQRRQEAQDNIMSDDEYHFNLIVEDGTEVGNILFWENDQYRYVEHFYIYPQFRGRSYGSKAIQTLCGMGKQVILEIEPAVDEMTIRRKGFYERNGFCANSYHYTHPPFYKELEDYELTVMSFPEKLSQEEFEGFCRYIREHIMSSSNV